MSLRIATNTQALAAQRFLNINHDIQNRSLERLASGSRINRAGDDAAGLDNTRCFFYVKFRHAEHSTINE
jgi:flagellin-like hook-associated protein FlgL